MTRNRYRSDYELSEYVDSNGRFHTSVTYKGEPYFFSEASGRVSMLKKMLPVLSLAVWLPWICGLAWASNAMHFLPAALCYVFCALPLALFTECCFAFRGMKEPLEHRHADRMNNTYPPVTLLLAVLSGAALTAGALCDIRAGFRMPGDLIWLVSCALLFGIGCFSFRLRKELRVCRKQPETDGSPASAGSDPETDTGMSF